MTEPKSSSNLIDGKKISQDIRDEVKQNVADLFEKTKQKPKLVVVIVGERNDSLTYVGMKQKACAECGIDSELVKLEEQINETVLIEKVRSLNQDDSVDGILVQLPLPNHIDSKKVLSEIDWHKDVDGLHPLNVGNLALRDHTPMFKPCTAEGCIELCRRYNIQISGAEVLILGRSNIVGMPASLLFQQENATVTICHSKTKDLKKHCLRADIIIAAIGKAHFVKGDWIREGAVVIDVGINSVKDSTRKSGFRLVGDVDFEAVKDKCKLITPVPGGVGPMTVAILMKNAYEAKKHKLEK